MMGIDIIGSLLVMLAVALMAVSPLHVTITRVKEKAVWFAAVVSDDDDRDTPPAAERERVASEVDAELADDPLIRATGELADIYNHV